MHCVLLHRNFVHIYIEIKTNCIYRNTYDKEMRKIKSTVLYKSEVHKSHLILQSFFTFILVFNYFLLQILFTDSDNPVKTSRFQCGL